MAISSAQALSLSSSPTVAPSAAYQFSYAGQATSDPVNPAAAGGGVAAVTGWSCWQMVAGSVLFLVIAAVAGRTGSRVTDGNQPDSASD